MKTNITKVMAVAAISVQLALHGEYVQTYSNDCSNRSSGKPVPCSEWMRYDYAVGGVLYDYATGSAGSYTWTESLPWSNPSKCQDGWVLGANRYFAIIPKVYEDDGTSRRHLAFDINMTGKAKAMAYQPVGNSFTNGCMEYVFDLHVPTSWGAESGKPVFRFYPAFRTYLTNPELVSNPLTAYPFGCGFQGQYNQVTVNSTEAVMVAARSSDKSGTGEIAGFIGTLLTAGNWYRYRVTVDLDASKAVTCALWDMGASVPAWNSVGTEVVSGVIASAYRFPSAATGPLEGFGLYAENVTSQGDVAKMPSVTNIRIAWRPTDASAFQPCYSNDFRTCWRRTLVKGGTSSAYPAPSGSGAGVFSSFPLTEKSVAATAATRLTPAATGGEWTVQDAGLDGWRRLSHMYLNEICVSESGTVAGKSLVMQGTSGNSYRYGSFVQPFGEKVTSGKVVIRADLKTPEYWSDNGGSHKLTLSLGNEALLTAYHRVRAERMAADAGFSTDSKGWVNANLYYVNDSSGVTDTSGSIPGDKWNRVEIVADLDSRTYSMKVWKFSDPHALDYEETSTPYYEKTGIAMRFGVTDISSFAITGFAIPGAGWQYAAAFDNIVVKKIPTGETEAQVLYTNDFDTRTIYNGVTPMQEIGERHNLQIAEWDFWTAGGSLANRASVLKDDGNACMALDGNADEPVCLRQMLPTALAMRGASRVSVDIRPPDAWLPGPTNRAFACVALGDGVFAAADVHDGTVPTDSAAIRFGFNAGGATERVCGKIASVAAFVRDGNADSSLDFVVDAKHWYRFVATVEPGQNAYSLVVYDQGTSHPADEAANGTVVAQRNNISFATDRQMRITTLGVSGTGFGCLSPRTQNRPGLPLFDNLKIFDAKLGVVIVLR